MSAGAARRVERFAPRTALSSVTVAAPRTRTDSPVAIASSMWVGSAGLMILGIQPVLLGALAQEGRLSEGSLGRLATVEVLALAAGSVVGPRILGAGRMRAKTAAAALALAPANLVIYATPSLAALFVSRAFAGLLEGLVLGAAIVVLTHTRHPDRLNGLFLAVQTIPQAVAAYALPVTLIPAHGAAAGFALLSLLALSAAAMALGLPDRGAAAEAAAPAELLRSPAVLRALAAVALWSAAIGSAWSYVERVAVQQGYSPQIVGLAMSASLTSQVLGAFAVAWIGWRLPYRIALCVGALLQALLVIALAIARAPGAYVAAACAFGWLWLALGPFQVRLLIDVEKTRRAAMLLAAVTLSGFSAGPLISSFGVSQSDVSGAFFVSAALLVASAALFAWTRQPRAAEGPQR